MKFLFVAVLILLILWSIYGYFGSRVEQTEYTVIKKTNGYEIRNYPTHIVAQTTVDGSYQESMSIGFRIVAGYIFGGNTKKEKIAMTAPVLVSNEGGSRVISFGMPKSYTLETLPTPTDSRVKIVEMPNKKFAVIKFSGYRTNVRIQEKEKKLLGVLSKEGIEVIGKPSYAGYNAPGTPPWMMRNEVLVEIK